MSFRARVRKNEPAGHPVTWPAGGESPAAGGWPVVQPAACSAGNGPAASGESLRQERLAGFREGEAAGRAAAEAELRPVMERLARTVEDLAALRPRLREQAERDLVRLAMAIARRVVRRELTIDPQAIAGLVKAALEQLASQEGVRVRVHPEHEAAVRACLAGRASTIEISSDPALERGSAVFETARGDLDASAEAQLAEIERGLTDRFRERP